MIPLPRPVADLCAELGAQPGILAVAVGGSRAAGTADAGSDWDLGVYYRGAIDLAILARHGQVHPPGSWGRLMNGGAWLTLDGLKVDVMLRDLDVVRHWTAEAAEGRYDVDALLGYVAGAPTYLLAAELAVSRAVVGTLPAGCSVMHPDPRSNAPRITDTRNINADRWESDIGLNLQ